MSCCTFVCPLRNHTGMTACSRNWTTRRHTHTGRLRRRRILYGKRCDVIKFSFSVKFYYALIRAGIVFSSRFNFYSLKCLAHAISSIPTVFQCRHRWYRRHRCFHRRHRRRVIATAISSSGILSAHVFHINTHWFINSYVSTERKTWSFRCERITLLSSRWIGFFHSFSISERRKTHLCGLAKPIEINFS